MSGIAEQIQTLGDGSADPPAPENLRDGNMRDKVIALIRGTQKAS